MMENWITEVHVVCGIIDGEHRPNVMVIRDYETAMEIAKQMKESGLYTKVYYKKEDLI